MRHPLRIMLVCYWALHSISGLAQPNVTEATPPAGAASSAEQKPVKPFSFDIKPVLIDTAGQTGAAIGVDYDLNYKRSFGSSGNTSVGSGFVTGSQASVTIAEGEVALRARGTLASSAEKNPNKLIDFTASGFYSVSRVEAWYRLGGNLGFETDQGFEKKQSVVALTFIVSKVGTIMNGDAGSLALAYGTVNPTADAGRKKVVGNLDSYRRWNAEVSYSIPVNKQKLRSIDLNYRHYQEVSPTSATSATGIDRNRLGLVRLNLDQDFFVQYSRGSLPFDQKSERAVKIGWSQKFE